MIKLSNGVLKETSYDIKDEAKLGSLFGIGNGYFGIRGSLEEFGEVFIQGTYIRGVFDQIVEIPQTFCDNIYMKRYYFDVQKLKEFEYEDSCINICDPLTIRFYVNNKLMLPWEGRVVKWERYIDYKTGGLVRNMVWDDGEGHLSEFHFVRYASFNDNHIILQEARIKRLNHHLDVKVEVGVDTLVKTNGQHKSILQEVDNKQNDIFMRFYMGNKYHHEVVLHSYNLVSGGSFIKTEENNGVYASIYTMNSDELVVKKAIKMYANVDHFPNYIEVTRHTYISYERELNAHLIAYKKAFDLVDIKIKDNKKADGLLRYANYQTLIGFDRYESVHSLSAKNLTAERYNQFVWWDAEIFQLPFVIATFPKAARSCLEYRYRHLNAARELAKQEGCKGAKFAFCDSVKGDENVWIYARHPFLQIHIASDVAYGVYNYYHQTLDKPFMLSMGLEMMKETSLYFASRVEMMDDGYYHLNNVTGTDEHHPYINDDAYTNYEVRFIASKTLKLAKELGFAIDNAEIEEINKLVNLYVPLPERGGIIPQFRGYLDLKEYLPLVGNGSAKGFQMKASGLYHESQIIKQHDVLNLYTYLDIDMPKDVLKANYKYYLKKCEASSSLTFPVNALTALMVGDNKTFLDNFYDMLEIDIRDIHNCAYQGVHAGCIAGGWYNIYKGIFGINPKEDVLEINPTFNSPFKDVEMKFYYHHVLLKIKLKNDEIQITSKGNETITLQYKNQTYQHLKKTILKK